MAHLSTRSPEERHRSVTDLQVAVSMRRLVVRLIKSRGEALTFQVDCVLDQVLAKAKEVRSTRPTKWLSVYMQNLPKPLEHLAKCFSQKVSTATMLYSATLCPITLP